MDIDQTTYNIHVFGDSQSRIYSSPFLPNYICNVYYVGPTTMHSVGNDNLTIDKLKDISKKYYKNYLPTVKPEYKHMCYPKNDVINNNDLVIYVFGELDLRNPKEILNNLVDKYINTILINREKYNVKYAIQAIIPPVDDINLNEFLNEYPINEDIGTRIYAINEINKLLKQSCEKNNIIFLDIVTYYKNENPICDKSKILILDLNENNLHININNPEGINYAFKLNCIPINIKYYKPTNKCKYPSSLNKFQRDYYKRVRIGHYILMVILYGSLFVPDFLIFIPIIFWITLFIFNYIFSGNLFKCFIHIIEDRASNCNDKRVDVELGFRKKDNVIIYFYIFSVLLILYRVYKYLLKKNIILIDIFKKIKISK
jgi:hypothetical protein